MGKLFSLLMRVVVPIDPRRSRRSMSSSLVFIMQINSLFIDFLLKSPQLGSNSSIASAREGKTPESPLFSRLALRVAPDDES